MAEVNRRVFLGGSLAATFSGSPNDRVNVALVGLGGRGVYLIDTFSKQENCRISAVCDIDTSRIERGKVLVEKAQGAAPRLYQDIRKLLEDKDVDVVSISTCNHWHALATIWACRAGKDVYVEKPASHTLWEGRKMVEAARKYNRIVQCGLQARSIAHYRRAVELVREGAIGKPYMARVICFRRRKSIGRKPDGAAPPGVDYDLWLGPARRRPFNPNRFHYNWHWFWDTGNGDIANQGVHELDVARWGLNQSGLPKSVQAQGGKFIYDDDQETPNTLSAVLRYDDCEIVAEVRGLPTTIESSIAGDSGVMFFGSEGTLALDPTGYQVFRGDELKTEPRVGYSEPTSWATAPLVENFLAAVRSRKAQDLACDIEEGHRSTALAHLANASYRAGRSLVVDPKAENFGGDAEANRYLTHGYREPFVVPAEV